MKFVRLSFAGFKVDFVDRVVALGQFRDWAERGTYPVQVVFGPEGCGKSALLRQATELLRDYDYSVALVSPMAEVPNERLVLTEELRELAMNALATIVGKPAAKLIDMAVELLYRAVRSNVRRRIALLLDDVFQAIGLDRATLLVKSLLNMIEYPSIDYERIVIVVATGEGVSRREIGRHTWAEIMPIWNMPKEGFRQLYEQLPGDKPPFEEVWRLTGGNPRMLGRLYRVDWSVDRAVELLIKEKDLRSFITSLRPGEVEALREAVEDPDTLYRRDRLGLMSKLVELNLIVDNLYPRRGDMWIDQPPPERDPELGIGEEVAWQTPMHREAVVRVLG